MGFALLDAVTRQRVADVVFSLDSTAATLVSLAHGIRDEAAERRSDELWGRAPSQHAEQARTLSVEEISRLVLLTPRQAEERLADAERFVASRLAVLLDDEQHQRVRDELGF